MSFFRDLLRSRLFPEGFGLFKGIPEIANIARSMTYTQRKKLKQRGIVPKVVYDILRYFGISVTLTRGMTLRTDELAWILINQNATHSAKNITMVCSDHSATELAQYFGRIILFEENSTMTRMHRLSTNYREE